MNIRLFIYFHFIFSLCFALHVDNDNKTLEKKKSTTSFNNIRHQFKKEMTNVSPVMFQSKFKPLMPSTSKSSSSKMLSLERLKSRVRRQFFRQINICHKRFQHCSQVLSPEFCASPAQNISFYLWARQTAKEIMTGAYDGFTNIQCSNDFVKHVLSKKNSLFEKRNKILSLIKGAL